MDPSDAPQAKPKSFLPSIAKNLSQAFEDCLNGHGIPDATALIARAKALAKAGEIDPLADLSKDRVYLFSGGKDRIVARSVVEAAKRFYIEAGVPQESVALMTREDAGHSILTTDKANACGAIRNSVRQRLRLRSGRRDPQMDLRRVKCASRAS